MLFFHCIQARLREAASWDKHVLLKKLRDALEALRGRVAGKNKDDVEEAIAMVSFFPPCQRFFSDPLYKSLIESTCDYN